MQKLIRISIVVVMVAALLPITPVFAQTSIDPLAPCQQLPLGASKIAICMPAGTPKGVVVFAHGYVNPNPERPPEIPIDQLLIPGSTTTLPKMITDMGFIFATTSYRQNGLAVKEGVEDILALVAFINTQLPVPLPIFITGASEGGLVTALAVEEHPEAFAGGFSTCGPIGDFRKQINYWGDFRVVFDYFFPGLLWGSPVSIPAELITAWETVVAHNVIASVMTTPLATLQLLSVTGAPTDPFVKQTRAETAVGILGYNVYATNQGKIELGGNPYGNLGKRYTGSLNDYRLNQNVERIAPDQAALDEINANYQTTGKLEKPLVTMHDIGDPIVPYWHENLYRAKVMMQGSAAMHANIPILRYGHCRFTAAEALFGFGVMVTKATLVALQKDQVQTALPDPGSYDEYLQLEQQFGPSGAGHTLYLPAIQQ